MLVRKHRHLCSASPRFWTPAQKYIYVYMCGLQLYTKWDFLWWRDSSTLNDDRHSYVYFCTAEKAIVLSNLFNFLLWRAGTYLWRRIMYCYFDENIEYHGTISVLNVIAYILPSISSRGWVWSSFHHFDLMHDSCLDIFLTNLELHKYWMTMH